MLAPILATLVLSLVASADPIDPVAPQSKEPVHLIVASGGDIEDYELTDLSIGTKFTLEEGYLYVIITAERRVEFRDRRSPTGIPDWMDGVPMVGTIVPCFANQDRFFYVDWENPEEAYDVRDSLEYCRVVMNLYKVPVPPPVVPSVPATPSP
ncbi:MAG: hypothetical protein UU08_C0026G0001 [Candidatus Uhrbacteria bacterium GW2011_GWE2_40_58]|nr:MAG: hypothetical protein UT94_C0035G0010 [Candidatus Uhrbacteria bacterium GW2011_GWF2_40_263]KKR67111.1 MAG: hypothetical protein UU08_C0026G0001 [Candidatus Uhrbacteria bacterium GW2011_GWE2_40_58]HCB56306.1 hypothetical protein [Candidatus Uhrbacteria bacterium]